MSDRVATGVQVARGYWARDIGGNDKTGLTASDFTISLRKKADGDADFGAASESVTVAELDATNLAGQYEFRFTPTEEATYVLYVSPTYTNNAGDEWRQSYTAVESLTLDSLTTLCTTAQVKSYLGDMSADDDTDIDSLCTQVTKFVQNYCRQTFTETTVTEYHGGGGREIVLKETPVQSVTSVHESTDIPRVYGASQLLTADTDYLLDDDYAILWRHSRKWLSGPRTVKVVYVAGYSSIPADLNLCAVRMVAILWHQRKRLGHSSLSMGESSSGFYDWREWPHDVQDTLDYYRDVARNYVV